MMASPIAGVEGVVPVVPVAVYAPLLVTDRIFFHVFVATQLQISCVAVCVNMIKLLAEGAAQLADGSAEPVVMVTIPAPAGVAHTPSPRQNVVLSAPDPL